MARGDIVDEFLNENRLADARAAEQADLAALCVRGDQVDDLDAGDKDAAFGRLVDEFGGLGVDRRAQVGDDRATFVDRLAAPVEDAAGRPRAARPRKRRTGTADERAGGQ